MAKAMIDRLKTYRHQYKPCMSSGIWLFCNKVVGSM